MFTCIPNTYAIVNDKAGYAYVNIAKAGCTSIKTAIAEHAGVSFEELQWRRPWKRPLTEIPDEYHVFTCVRHPLARLVSCWADYVANPKPAELRLNSAFSVITGQSFDVFCKWVRRNQQDPNLHYAPQWQQLQPRMPDQIMRLEDIEDEWPQLMDRFGLPALPTDPVRQRKSDHADWWTLYDPRLARTMTRIYGEDMRKFGYAVNGSMEVRC